MRVNRPAKPTLVHSSDLRCGPENENGQVLPPCPPIWLVPPLGQAFTGGKSHLFSVSLLNTCWVLGSEYSAPEYLAPAMYSGQEVPGTLGSEPPGMSLSLPQMGCLNRTGAARYSGSQSPEKTVGPTPAGLRTEWAACRPSALSM